MVTNIRKTLENGFCAAIVFRSVSPAGTSNFSFFTMVKKSSEGRKSEKILKDVSSSKEVVGQLPESVNFWEEPQFLPEHNPHGVLETSSFRILFPAYRAAYLKEAWPTIESRLSAFKLSSELDISKRSMEISTTRETRDPFIIIRARDALKLLARSVDWEQAQNVLKEDVYAEVINVGGLVRNKETFVRRRQRLIGPNGSTLKVIEMLSRCTVVVAGQTVSVIGPWQGLKCVRKIVIDCMKNVHPIYNLKTLMVRNELSKNPAMKGKDWTPFLPQFKKG